MINVMQIITNMPLFAIAFPANSKYFFRIIVDIMNFNLLPSDTISAGIFKFSDTDAVNDDFDELDIFWNYIPNLFILNQFTLFI